MDDQDIARLDTNQLEGLHKASAKFAQAQEMCKTTYWKDLEKRAEELIFDRRKKWLSPQVSKDAADIIRIKAMALKDFLDFVKQDIVKGKAANEILAKHAKFKSNPQQ